VKNPPLRLAFQDVTATVSEAALKLALQTVTISAPTDSVCRRLLTTVLVSRLQVPLYV
jgi:hypothetical protein